MCLLVAGLGVHPRYPFVFAGNRDEFHERPTRAAHWWPAQDAGPDGVLGGRDLVAGGTWLGLNRQGRFATVTNYRQGGEAQEATHSRGKLITDFITGEHTRKQFAKVLDRDADQYAGFNLLFGSLDPRTAPLTMAHFSNRGPRHTALTPGIHTLSNRHLNTPWPKAQRLQQAMTRILQGELATEQLFDMLADRTRAPDDQLPDTGLSPMWEQLLSSPFIVSDAYGTRACTVILVRDDGHVRFIERSFNPLAECTDEQVFEFTLETPA